MKVKVDKSAHSAVAVCGCGWRGLAVSHEQALRRAVSHEQSQHPKDRHARAALASLLKRSTEAA